MKVARLATQGIWFNKADTADPTCLPDRADLSGIAELYSALCFFFRKAFGKREPT